MDQDFEIGEEPEEGPFAKRKDPPHTPMIVERVRIYNRFGEHIGFLVARERGCFITNIEFKEVDSI